MRNQTNFIASFGHPGEVVVF